jgi:demethylmenaquinone methyltransferase/2-methoxy-6-polyprenyl-1,4-benzoquinol methylase
MGQNGYTDSCSNRLKTKSAYDHLSRWYDFLSAGSEQPLVQLGLGKLNPSKGESILEIGSGTGEAILQIGNLVGVTGQAIGIDISSGMLKVAGHKVSRSNCSSQVQFGMADAVQLPIRSNCIDAIFFSFTLELFDDSEILMILKECRRVLTPGGRVGMVVMVSELHENLPQKIYKWFHTHFPVYVDCRAIDLNNYLSRAGYKIINDCRKTMWGLSVEICIAERNEE